MYSETEEVVASNKYKNNESFVYVPYFKLCSIDSSPKYDQGRMEPLNELKDNGNVAPGITRGGHPGWSCCSARIAS